jgi:hypothetical protein
MVGLVREPQNPYDCWAIRVDNIRGEKVKGCTFSAGSMVNQLAWLALVASHLPDLFCARLCNTMLWGARPPTLTGVCS